MNKLILILALATTTLTAWAGDGPKIKFEKMTMSMGVFPESDPVQTTTFTFTNEGDEPLIIQQAVASCGCTVPKYSKAPVQPGASGEIQITYNGKGRFPGHFKKSITIRTNGEPDTMRIYIDGTMTEAE